MSRLGWISLLFLVQVVWGQSLNALSTLGTTYVSLNDVAQQLGYSTNRSGNSFTVRAQAGVVVVFENSPDILFKRSDSAEALERSDQNLALPVIRQNGEWFAPEQLLDLMGFDLSDNALTTQDGRSFRLSFPPEPFYVASDRYEVLELGNGVPGLSFYAPGAAGAETLSLLVTDLSLLSLALPEQQGALDGVMSKFRDQKPLYFTLTALAPSSWQTSFTVAQGGRRELLQAPFRVQLLAGAEGSVGPEAPVSGLILLPDWVNLREPLELTWADISARVQFRR